MNENGNKYALAALRDKRATLAGEIAQLDKQAKWKRDQLEHVDATLALFDPDYRVGSIAAKKPYRHIKLFKQGELEGHSRLAEASWKANLNGGDRDRRHGRWPPCGVREAHHDAAHQGQPRLILKGDEKSPSQGAERPSFGAWPPFDGPGFVCQIWPTGKTLIAHWGVQMRRIFNTFVGQSLA